MKKHILAAIGIVLISVPCFAQGIKADSLSAGSVASSGSIDGSGNIVLSNSFTGAHSLIGTNAHLMFVDQYGTEFYFWTNGFGFWKTNGDYAYATNGGDFHISGTFYGGGLGGSGPTNWPWSSITNQPTIPSTANLLATNGNASALTGLTSAQIAAAGGVTNVSLSLLSTNGVSNGQSVGVLTWTNAGWWLEPMPASSSGVSVPIVPWFGSLVNATFTSTMHFWPALASGNSSGIGLSNTQLTGSPASVSGVGTNFLLMIGGTVALGSGTNGGVFIFTNAPNATPTYTGIKLLWVGGAALNQVVSDTTDSLALASGELVSVVVSNSVAPASSLTLSWAWQELTTNLPAAMPGANH